MAHLTDEWKAIWWEQCWVGPWDVVLARRVVGTMVERKDDQKAPWKAAT